MDPDIDPSTEIMEQVGTFLRFLRRPGRGARSEPTQPRMPSYPRSTGPQGARMRRRPYGCGCCAPRAWCRRSSARCEAGGAGSRRSKLLCLPLPSIPLLGYMDAIHATQLSQSAHPRHSAERGQHKAHPEGHRRRHFCGRSGAWLRRAGGAHHRRKVGAAPTCYFARSRQVRTCRALRSPGSLLPLAGSAGRLLLRQHTMPGADHLQPLPACCPAC